jgi:hypothetical protein
VSFHLKLLLTPLREEQRPRVFENRVLRRIFGPEREEVVGGWRRLQNEELHNVYDSLNIIRVIKSWKRRWTEHVACMEGMYTTFRPENMNGIHHGEELGTDGKEILKCIFGK